MIRRPGGLASCLIVLASLALPNVADATADSYDELRLVTAYSPVVMLRAQEADPPCDTTEEQFSPPTSVNVVLGNERVRLLRYVDGKDVFVKRAPTAADVASLGDAYYLDLPGEPLSAGCTYAKDFRGLKKTGEVPAETYAHIARQAGHPGLVVQYWFFYYFNQFNDVHEGDWEGMQIAFDADTPEAALAQGPSRIALFQHGGGERADWGDTKVQKEDTHPVVYSAAGSHATFYDEAIYIENGQNGSGVGCDNTSEPLQRVRPQPVLLPDVATPGTGSQWLSYRGHWGQREKGFNIGPQGPITKPQWQQPFSWMEGVRQDSSKLPGGALLGPATSTAYCGAIEEVSKFINLEAKNRFGAIALALGILLLLAVPPFLTRWRPIDLSTLRRRWAVGQLLRAAVQLYVRHWRVLMPIGLSALVVIGAFDGVQWLVQQVHRGHDLTLRVEPFGLELQFRGSFDGLAHPIGGAIVSGAAVAFLRLREEGAPSTLSASYRAMYERLWRVVVGQLLAIALVYVMMFTVIGIPAGIYFYIAWQFIQQEILFENSSIGEAMRGSDRLVRGHWWRTVTVAGLLLLLSVVTGPILGFVLIFLNWSPWVVNAVGSVVFALFVPYVAVGRTLLYFDLAAREAEVSERRGRRRRWLSRPRPAASA